MMLDESIEITHNHNTYPETKINGIEISQKKKFFFVEMEDIQY